MTLRKYVVGNWKMNGLRADLAEAATIAAIASECGAVDVAICPPATLVSAMIDAIPGLSVGGQDCHAANSGAYTGSISAAMLTDLGAKLTIVGHSERREAFDESDTDVQAKAVAALDNGLSVILCVGEPRAVREAGSAIDYVLAQVAGSLPATFAPARLAIAYEPIWAIGTGLVPTAADVAAMHDAIRSALISQCGDNGNAVRILYGGSVNGDNAGELLGIANVDGALVGGASLTAGKFAPIIQAAAAL